MSLVRLEEKKSAEPKIIREPKLKILPVNRNLLADSTIFSKVMAVIMIGGIAIGSFLVLRKFFDVDLRELKFNNFVEFLEGKGIIAIVVGMMVAQSARDLVKSLTDNMFMPLLQPIMPFLQKDFPIQIGPFIFDIGSLVSDILMFMANLYIIYIIMAMFSKDVTIKSTVAV